MKTIKMLVLVSVGCLAWSAVADESASLDKRWRMRFDIGGTFPEETKLTELDGPVPAGAEMKLSPGLQFDLAAGYRITPWLSLEAELGFTFNTLEDWYYPSSELWQMMMMANVLVEYPRGRFVPFAGVGAGGVLSTLSFGNYYYYGYSDADGSGTDFVPAIQAFAGVRYQFNNEWNLGLVYRFLATADQEWNVDMWYGGSTHVAVDSVRLQSICLVITGSF